jgi:hypothetical protein
VIFLFRAATQNPRSRRKALQYTAQATRLPNKSASSPDIGIGFMACFVADSLQQGMAGRLPPPFGYHPLLLLFAVFIDLGSL